MQRKRLPKIALERKQSPKTRMRNLLIKKVMLRRSVLRDILGITQEELIQREKSLGLAFQKVSGIKTVDDVRKSQPFGEFKSQFRMPENDAQKRELEKYFIDVSWVIFERFLKK